MWSELSSPDYVQAGILDACGHINATVYVGQWVAKPHPITPCFPNLTGFFSQRKACQNVGPTNDNSFVVEIKVTSGASGAHEYFLSVDDCADLTNQVVNKCSYGGTDLSLSTGPAADGGDQVNANVRGDPNSGSCAKNGWGSRNS